MNAPASPQPGTFGARGVALSSPSGVRLQPGFRHPGDHRHRTTWRGRRALRFSPSTSEAAGRVAPDMDVDMDARRAASGRPASMRRQRSIKRRQRPQLHDHVVARTYHLPKRHLSERLADEIQALNLSSARGYNPAAASSRPQPLHNQKFYRPPPMLRVPAADLGDSAFGSGSSAMPSTPRASNRRRSKPIAKHKAIQRIMNESVAPGKSLSGLMLRESAGFAHGPGHPASSPRSSSVGAGPFSFDSADLAPGSVSPILSATSRGGDLGRRGSGSSSAPLVLEAPRRRRVSSDTSDSSGGSSPFGVPMAAVHTGSDGGDTSMRNSSHRDDRHSHGHAVNSLRRPGIAVDTSARVPPAAPADVLTPPQFTLSPPRLRLAASPTSATQPRLHLVHARHHSKKAPTPPSPLSPHGRGRSLSRTTPLRGAPHFGFCGFSGDGSGDGDGDSLGPTRVSRSKSVPSGFGAPAPTLPTAMPNRHATSRAPRSPHRAVAATALATGDSGGQPAAPGRSLSAGRGGAPVVATSPAPSSAPEMAWGKHGDASLEFSPGDHGGASRQRGAGVTPRHANDVSHSWFFRASGSTGGRRPPMPRTVSAGNIFDAPTVSSGAVNPRRPVTRAWAASLAHRRSGTRGITIDVPDVDGDADMDEDDDL